MSSIFTKNIQIYTYSNDEFLQEQEKYSLSLRDEDIDRVTTCNKSLSD